MTLEELKRAVTGLTPDEHARFRAWFDAFMAARPGVSYIPTQAEQDGIARGLKDVAAGRLASDQEVEAVFTKHRLKP